jgi:DNA polymerase III delta prime subunit
MTKRKCEHWLKTFVDWMGPRVHVAESYIVFSGLYMLACALRRRVWIPREGLLGSWDCYPHLYLMFVAPPGYGKTTTITLAEELIAENPVLNKSPIGSMPKIAHKLSEVSDNSLYIVAEEFGEFMAKMGKEGYEFLTGAFDGKKKMEIDTFARGLEFSQSPCVNFAAGTTLAWISENMPESVIGGGFAARVIFLYEDQFRWERMYYQDVDFKELNKLKDDLEHDLNIICTDIEGAFDIEKDAMEYVEAWLKTNKPYNRPSKLQGYYTRKKVHLHKLAMLYHISYSNELILNKQDFEVALKFLELSERNLPLIFGQVGKNKYAMDTRSIHQFIIQNGQVSKKEILSQFESVGDVAQLEKLLKHLLDAGRIVSKGALYSTA